MTLLSVVTTKQQFGNDTLSITLRNVSGEPAVIQAMLVVKTVSLWLYLRKLIDAGERMTPLNKTPEMAIQESTMQQGENGQSGYTFDAWQETRVTVFDWSNHYGLTVHSDTMAQTALDTYWGMHDALVELTPQNAPQTAPASAPAHEAPAAPTNTPKAQKGGSTQCNGKKAIKELPHNAWFYMPVAKISAVMSPDGKLKWELYGFYGSNPGKFADLVIWADNENSIKNGLNAALSAIVDKPGQSVTGKWFAKGKVIEKDDKKAIYTNLLFDEQEHSLNVKPAKTDERADYADAYADNEDEFDDMPM